MIIPEKKKAVSVILSKFKPDGSERTPDIEVKPEEEINEHDESLKAIAEDIMSAVESKSAHDLLVALRAFISECSMHEDDEE